MQVRQTVGLPITPELFLFATDAERAAGRKALHIAKDDTFDWDVSEHEIAGDVVFVHFGANKTQGMQPLRHGSEGEVVRTGSVNEGTFSRMIASQEEMLFLLVPHSEAEGSGKMLDAFFLPALPRGQ